VITTHQTAFKTQKIFVYTTLDKDQADMKTILLKRQQANGIQQFLQYKILKTLFGNLLEQYVIFYTILNFKYSIFLNSPAFPAAP